VTGVGGKASSLNTPAGVRGSKPKSKYVKADQLSLKLLNWCRFEQIQIQLTDLIALLL